MEHDDELLERYLGGEEPTEDELRQAIREATISGEIFPVFCGSAFKNKGVQALLDGVIDYLPSPLDIPPIQGHLPHKDETRETREADDDAPFSALAFKIMTDPYVGKLTFFRVYSGSIPSGSHVMNATKGRKERIGRILQMHANKREERDEVFAGDIAAAIGLKEVRTGDTLCDPAHPIILEAMKFPEPVIAVAIEPKTKADQDKLGSGLGKLADEDPTFRVHTDDETGQTIISGMGELHLEVLVDRLRREFGVGANIGRPQVSYRETIRRPTRERAREVRPADRWPGAVRPCGHQHLTHRDRRRFPLRGQDPGWDHSQGVHQLGGAGGQGRPADRSHRRLPHHRREGGARGRLLPRRGLLGDGLQDRRVHGPEGGREAVQAGSSGARHGRGGRDSIRLLGDLIGDLSSRRGRIGGMTDRGDAQVIGASVPLGEMFGYSTTLRSLSQGRAVYTMQFSHYEEVPQSKADEIMAAGG